jgi:hypothetical protein
MDTQKHKFDFCVIGGGMSGICAAIAAARHGLKTALVQDRPVLGGNASSEIRMWICGAKDNLETGIVEEIRLDNIYYNQHCNYSIWDALLYGKVKSEENISLFLNTSCTDATMENNIIKSVKCWQITTYTWHEIEADNFADCSGDSILAPLTGAEYRTGREARAEFNEDIEPEKADSHTMGMSLLLQPREHAEKKEFRPLPWINKYPTPESLNNRVRESFDAKYENYWWIELGGTQDTIKETESIRDELAKITLGVWDHIKNQSKCNSDNWALDWMGFLPGKRESLRYVGDHLLTQNDVSSEGKFDDIAAYGGWPMDDHYPEGFHHKAEGTVFHKSPSPYGIPYRCLYSKNIENLFFAGRNISATHAAMSSTRVMATCSIMGQAVGTAASIASKKKITPRGVYEKCIDELKQKLMDDDAYLPWNNRKLSKLSCEAKLSSTSGTEKELLNGLARPIEGKENCWKGGKSDYVEYKFAGERKINSVRIVFDSDLQNRELNMRSNYPLNAEPRKVPDTIIKSFRIEALKNGEWETVHSETENFQRLKKINISTNAEAIRIVPESCWNCEEFRIFEFDVL